MLNLRGQVLYHMAEGSASELTIHVKDWAKGFYLLEIRTKRRIVAEKLTVE